MSLKFKDKETIFTQRRVRRNFSRDFGKLIKASSSYDDIAVLSMFADATCSTKPTVNIEKIHLNVFAKQKVSTLKFSKGIIETLEILSDKELMTNIKLSREDAKKGRLVPWKKIKIPT